jgi:hypothetical protein
MSFFFFLILFSLLFQCWYYCLSWGSISILKSASWYNLAVLPQLVPTLLFPRQWVRFPFFHTAASVENIFIYLTWRRIGRDGCSFVSLCRIYETQTGIEMKILRINSWRADYFAFCTNMSSVCVSGSVFVLQNCPSHGFVFLLKLILRSNKNFSREVGTPASRSWDPGFKCRLFDRLPCIMRLFLFKDNTWRTNEIFVMKLGVWKN